MKYANTSVHKTASIHRSVSANFGRATCNRCHIAMQDSTVDCIILLEAILLFHSVDFNS